MDKSNSRLNTIDSWGHRLTVIPAEVKGRFRKRRNWVQAVLILFFLILPWSKINGYQTVLFDITKREFIFFGVLLKSHDAPLLFLILAGLAFSLALATAVAGRVWCGWACPQTVFIDGVFRRIEIWLEGNYIQRRQTQSNPMTFSLAIKKIFKWLLFLGISSVLAHSFAAYFVGAVKVANMVAHAPSENIETFVFVLVLTLILTFNFGWFREQFCIIMCPYGRIQSVLTDEQTVTVTYDKERGEPRRAKEISRDKQGDCIDCRRCFEVCPSRIDIRDGVQLECIGCTACIDACDEIMTKVSKPKGLIRYSTATGGKLSPWRWRNAIYLGMVLLCFSGLARALYGQKDFSAHVSRAPGLPFTLVPNEGQPLVLNHFKIRLENLTQNDVTICLKLSENLTDQKITMAPENFRVTVPARNDTTEVPFFTKMPRLEQKFPLKGSLLTYRCENGELLFSAEMIVQGPL